ncbi:TetR family transcriptional regulator [Isoptericola halotolerans]|uniref:AcrR family transcriptional regulator n=1 Tax=Isoptericola halotolerans TaxID=300560 RepID=A0ABX2A3E6_9MICO|nr:TetR/AcrR family transcriptional regulator [Isoptericola halotolerans]NOV97390.1 AcrR family transcriptional regulator [Isoptericola halotolerans]
MTTPPATGTLRSRRIARSRQRLLEVALPAFAERGYDAVTVDWLCEQAEVSKRSFFRYFEGKEDLALTPLNDVWRTLIDDLDAVLARSGPLLEVVGDALVEVVDRMPAGWERLAVLSARLSGTNPAIDAAGMVVCERFTQRVVDAIAARLATVPGADVSARVVCAVAVASHRAAVDTWQSAPDAEVLATRAELCALLRESFAAAPAALEARLP